MAIRTINPATGVKVRSFESFTESEIEARLQRGTNAFRMNRRTSFADRARWMMRVSEILESDASRFARMMTNEMGKTLRSAHEEAAKCAWACRYFAEKGESFLADQEIKTDATRSYIRCQPIGLVLAIMPWNFPFWQVFRFAAPALMAGNAALLKHASNVPQCALMIEQIFRDAGFPQDTFQTLLIEANQVERLLSDPRVSAVTLTGSVQAGSNVASIAGKQIKKIVLELGGSDPFIVMPSANLYEAVSTAVKARNINNGQSCIAAKRFIIAEEIAEEFERRFVEGMQALTVGDPMDERTDIGPLATAELLNALDEQVSRTLAAGARLVCGGSRLEGQGYFYTPTVLADIPSDSPAYHEELFGPVASLFRVAGIGEAVRLANDTTFGLASSVWTNDEQEQKRFIDEIEAGLVFVNGMVASDPRLPFGGVKQSGYGRELSVYGIREFVNIKTIWIKDQLAGNRTETE